MSSLNDPLHKQEILCIQYKTVLAFLQAVQEAGVGVIYLEPLECQMRASHVWGVQLTARVDDEIHVAWVVAA